MGKKYLLAGLVVGIIIISTLYLMKPYAGKYGSKDSRAAAGSEQLANLVQHRPPQALADIAFSVDGVAHNISDFRGEVLLVNFWATWCAPCRIEMPLLDNLAHHFAGAKFRVIALSLDRGEIATPQEFLKQIGVKHLTLAHDPSFKAGRDVRLRGMPTSLIIGKDGRELARLVGEAEWDSKAAVALIESLL